MGWDPELWDSAHQGSTGVEPGDESPWKGLPTSGVAKVGPGRHRPYQLVPVPHQLSTMKSDGAVKSHRRERLQIGNVCL